MCRRAEIQAFFRDLRIKDGGVHTCFGRDGRPNGEAFVGEAIGKLIFYDIFYFSTSSTRSLFQIDFFLVVGVNVQSSQRKCMQATRFNSTR